MSRDHSSGSLGFRVAPIAVIAAGIVGFGWFFHEIWVRTHDHKARSSSAPPQTEAKPPLEEQIRELETSAEEKRQFLNMLVEGSPYSDPWHRAQSKAWDQVKAHREQRRRLSRQIDTLRKLSGIQCIEFAAGMPVAGNPVRPIHERYVRAKHDLISLNASGLGKRHPRVLEQMAMVARRQQEIDQAILELKSELRNQLREIDDHLNTAEKKLQERTAALAALPPDHFDFRRAADDFTRTRNQLEELREQLAASKTPQ